VSTAFFGISGHSLNNSFQTEASGIDSKVGIFCQCGNRALQQETRPRWTQAGLPVSELPLMPVPFCPNHRHPIQRSGCSWNTSLQQGVQTTAWFQRKGENPMKTLISVIAVAMGLAFTGPAFAGDVKAAKTEADCVKAGGVWDAATSSCSEKKM
jgi:hypothetical protein